MTKSEVKAIIHEVMTQFVLDNLHDEPNGELMTHNNSLVYSLNKSLCQAIDEAEDEAEWIRENNNIQRTQETSPYKYRCSFCWANHRARFDYCPTCGKKMKAR